MTYNITHLNGDKDAINSLWSPKNSLDVLAGTLQRYNSDLRLNLRLNLRESVFIFNLS